MYMYKWFLNFLPGLFKRKMITKFLLLLASLETLANSKSCSESHIKLMFRLCFAIIGRFSPVYTHGMIFGTFIKTIYLVILSLLRSYMKSSGRIISQR
jgi:hypothetical protein